MTYWRLLGTKVNSLCMNAVTERTAVTAMTCWRLQGTAVDDFVYERRHNRTDSVDSCDGLQKAWRSSFSFCVSVHGRLYLFFYLEAKDVVAGAPHISIQRERDSLQP